MLKLNYPNSGNQIGGDGALNTDNKRNYDEDRALFRQALEEALSDFFDVTALKRKKHDDEEDKSDNNFTERKDT